MSAEDNQASRRLRDMLRPLIADDRVLAAVAAVPRERFVAANQTEVAYDNAPLPIGCGQTISQPLVVARMCEVLAPQPQDAVLDIGTGSGYHAAVLARLADHVYSIERHAELSQQAAENLRAAGIDNVTLVVGDGARGLPEHAPYDAINVAAAARAGVPAELEVQMAPGGRLVIPVQSLAPPGEQHLVLVRREGDRWLHRALEPVRFVPLIE